MLDGVTELVGDFTDAHFAAFAVADTDAVVTTVHPMGADRETQHRIGVLGTMTVARAAVAAGVGRLVHVSTAAVYDRAPGVGDVDESSPLVGDDAGDYATTKRDADLSLAGVDGITRVLLRPPAILGPGATSVWNTLRPKTIRDDASQRHAVADQTFAWVHVADLSEFAAGLATGSSGPHEGACTPVDVVAGSATMRQYHETVTRAIGVEAVWDDQAAWTGRLLADRAHSWGWQPGIDLAQALAEVETGLRR